MNWGSKGPLRTEGDAGYGPLISSTEFLDEFGERRVVGAYITYLEDYGEQFKSAIDELDDEDTWNVRYCQGCFEAIDGLVVNSGYGSFSRIVEACEHRLTEIDEHSKGINKQNDYWRRYFDGQVQTYTEVKKQAEKWDEVMDWVEAFDND